MATITYSINVRLAELMGLEGITPEDVSNRSGISVGWVRRYINAGYHGSTSKWQIKRIAHVFGLTVDEFMASGCEVRERRVTKCSRIYEEGVNTHKCGIDFVRRIIGLDYISAENRELAIRTPSEYGAVHCEDGMYRQ